MGQGTSHNEHNKIERGKKGGMTNQDIKSHQRAGGQIFFKCMCVLGKTVKS